LVRDQALPKPDVRLLSYDELEVLAMRSCRCQRMLTVGLAAGPAPPPYTCLAHLAIAELERRDRVVARSG
jgi:hypothetical protein